MIPRIVEQLVKRRDIRMDKEKATEVLERTKRLTDDNRAIVEDIRRLERGLHGRS